MENPNDAGATDHEDYPRWFWALVGIGAAIVVVLPLAWLLMGNARSGPLERKNAEACIYNLREVWLSTAVYAEDHGAFPPAGRWTEELTPYLRRKTGGMALLKCPSFDSSYGYAMQTAFGGRKPTDINHPDRALVLFDSTQGRPNAHDALESFPVLQRHMGRGNATFADGSVRPLTHKEAKEYVIPTLHAE